MTPSDLNFSSIREHAGSGIACPDVHENTGLSRAVHTSPEYAAIAKENEELKTKLIRQEEEILYLRSLLASRANSPSKFNVAQKFTFMTLPAEIRLKIYELLLVDRYTFSPEHPHRVQPHMHGMKRTIKFELDRPVLTRRDLETAILRTCTQIRREATPILYGKNMFRLRPKDLTHLLARAGLVNFSMIKSLRLEVGSDLCDHLQMVEVLVAFATGLHHLEVVWYAKPRYNELVFDKWNRGLGDSVEFVRALGGIQNLRSLVIEGYYAKAWPEYLGRRMAVPVKTYRGIRYEITHESADGRYPEHQKEIEELRGREFDKFQEDTLHLLP